MEVLNNYQRKKLDERNDEEFYSDPKFVYHLDLNFRNYLSNVYKKEISDYSTVLDLMSSWDSYLPKEKKYKKVIGHGLNKQELERNKILDTYWIQNLFIIWMQTSDKIYQIYMKEKLIIIQPSLI